MIVPVMAISNLVLTQQIYSEETNGAHAHYREPVPLKHVNLNHVNKIEVRYKVLRLNVKLREFLLLR